jgi:hypothetical protein
MAEQEEAVARFQEVTDCADPTFAASFLQVRTPPNLRRVCMSCSPIQPPPRTGRCRRMGGTWRAAWRLS